MIVEASDNQIHLAHGNSQSTLCGQMWTRLLPYVPLDRFGEVVLLESGEREMPWCSACSNLHVPVEPSGLRDMERDLKARGILS